MGRRTIVLGMMATALSAMPASPARAEFFTFDQMRNMCRGEAAEPAQFRTDAGHRLLAQSLRERCRMYLLGRADEYLQGDQRRCPGTGTSDSEVAEALVQELVSRTEAPDEGIAGLVRDVLRSRYGCA